MKYEYHAGALAEYAGAALFYDKRRPGLGAEFVAEVEKVINQILTAPGRWPKIAPDIRRCRLRRFPFGLLYAEENGVVIIIAVMHLSRKPGYWRARVK